MEIPPRRGNAPRNLLEGDAPSALTFPVRTRRKTSEGVGEQLDVLTKMLVE